MTQEYVVYLFREAFYTMLTISAPALLLSLLVGLVISIFQAATSIQEFTLTFVPKIIVMAVALGLFLPWIAAQLLEFSRGMFMLNY